MNTEILEDLIINVDNYKAHILEKNKEVVKSESLAAHTSLTLDYFRKLWKEKGIEDVLDRFCLQMNPDIQAESKEFLKEMIIGIPLFHDTGKINPEFQIQNMKNRNVCKSNCFYGIGKKHSIISAVLYMDYFLEEIKKKVKAKEDKKWLRALLFLHSYAIDRHHSDLEPFESFLEKLEVGHGRDILGAMEEGQLEKIAHVKGISVKGIGHLIKDYKTYIEQLSREESIGMYAYVKLLYSLLVASDYYATSEFMSGEKSGDFGNLNAIEKWIEVYENTPLMKKIRKYQAEGYPKDERRISEASDINELRTEMLLDVERTFRHYKNQNFFYLEAPTGGGKSNMAMDLSFQLVKEDKRLGKIYYIYPFNTLVEQNLQSLKRVFGENQEIFQDIVVVNSLTPIKTVMNEKRKEADTEDTLYYQKALLDRQFLNYPMILSTHVTLFDTMFGNSKESAFGFHQLVNSVIVLDEIQSYKNTIWAEIVCFLKEFSYLLNIKIIIMSATLPNLDLLSGNTFQGVSLLQDREKYFSNPCFKNRVQVSYELLESEDMQEDLYRHVRNLALEDKRILIEFIKKDSAFGFFRRLKEDTSITCPVEHMSGEDSIMERSRILDLIKEEKRMILVATQVIEAGVDIDMDIGYKNISKLDSEEQFLGRINRSCLRQGMVYFFETDYVKSIYKNDVRTEKEFTLENMDMRQILVEKEFHSYYEKILNVLKQNKNDMAGPDGLKEFFSKAVAGLSFDKVKEKMELISEDSWSMSVYLARVLEDREGNLIDGHQVWEEYAGLLKDSSMDYAEKTVKLSRVKSQMNYFIYQIKRNSDLLYNDKIGEIFYIDNGEKYFDNGKLDRKKIQGEIGEFVDFI